MKLKKLTSVIAVAVASLLIFTGCGNNNQPDSAQAEQTHAPSDTGSSAVSTTNAPQATNSSSGQTVASDYYLSLGTLEKGVVVEGNNRDRDEVDILNGKLVFPLGTIHSVIVKENDKKERFVNATEKEVRSLLSSVEGAECSTSVTETADKKVETILVYQTRDNEYRTIYMESAGNDYYLVRVKEDDRDEFAEIEDIDDKHTGNDYEVVQIHSKEVTRIIKKWINR